MAYLRERDAEYQRRQDTQNRDHERELWVRDQEYQRRDEVQRLLFEQQADSNRQFQHVMMTTSLQMADSVAQNTEVLRSFKRQSDEDSASDRDSVASTIRRRTIEGRTMVPLMYNVPEFSTAPVRPTVMIPLSSNRVLPTSAGVPKNSDVPWTTVTGRLPTSRQLIPPTGSAVSTRRTRDQRRAEARRGQNAMSPAVFNGPGIPSTGSGVTGRGATSISGSGGVTPRSGTVPVQIDRSSGSGGGISRSGTVNSSGTIPRSVGPGVTTVNSKSGAALPCTAGSGVINSGFSATIPRTNLGSGVSGGVTTYIPRTILGSGVSGGVTTLPPLGAAETTIRIPSRKSEPPEVVTNKSPSPSDTRPSVTSTHFQRVAPKENGWTRVGSGGRTSRIPNSITIQPINDEEMMELCQRSEQFCRERPDDYFSAVFPPARKAFNKYRTGVVTIEAWRSLPEVISRYYDTNGDWAYFVGLTADNVAMCNALLQSMAVRREDELRLWVKAYPAMSGDSSGSSTGSDGEGGSRGGGAFTSVNHRGYR